MTRHLFPVLALFGLLLGCDKSHSTTPPPAPSASSSAAQRVVSVKATKTGFVPAEIRLKQGEVSAIEFERVSESQCVRAVRMPWMKKAKDLAVGAKVLVPIPTDKSGTFTYACWMNMLYGRVIVEASK